MPAFHAQCTNYSGLSDLAAGFLECAEFSSLSEEDSAKPLRGWSRDAKRLAHDTVRKWLATINLADLEMVRPVFESLATRFNVNADYCIGHDIWYDSAGHGVGFEDRATHKDSQTVHDALGRLGAAARKLRSLDVYRGDSGWLHLG